MHGTVEGLLPLRKKDRRKPNYKGRKPPGTGYLQIKKKSEKPIEIYDI